MSEKDRMLAGELYRADDRELLEADRRARRLTRLFNATTEEELDRRLSLLNELLGSMGEGSYIEPPFRCDYGSNIHIGVRFFANFDCIVLDACPVVIGDDVMFGPRVCLTTATHPIDAQVRSEGLEYAKSITIGDKVWLGAQVVVNPGVTIGENTVIGSGSVVTSDIPANVVAVGNPCRVLRSVTEEDAACWQEKRAAYMTAVGAEE